MILLSIVCIALFVLGFLFCYYLAECLQKTKKVSNGYATVYPLIAFLCIAIFCFFIIVPGVSLNSCIGNAEIVTKNDGVVYFDADTNEYFRTECSDWNIFDLYDRVVIDNYNVK